MRMELMDDDWEKKRVENIPRRRREIEMVVAGREGHVCWSLGARQGRSCRKTLEMANRVRVMTYYYHALSQEHIGLDLSLVSLVI